MMRPPLRNTLHGYSALIFLSLSFLFLASCGEDGDGAPGETVTLEAGTAVDGPHGTKFRAQTDSISEPLDVNVLQTTAPTDEVPLPSGIQTRGQAYKLTPERTVTTATDKPFLVGLPIPEDANLENVAVAVKLEPDEYWARFGEGGRPDDFERRESWSFQEAYIAQGQVATTLPYLPTGDGKLMTVVESPEFESFDGSEVQPMSHSDEGFAGNCVGGFGDAPESCGSSEERAAASDLQVVFHDIQELGYTDPALNQRVNVVPQLFNSDLAFGPYVMRLRPCSETESGLVGKYIWASDRAWTCIDQAGYGGDETSTVRHEFFHASQYGYKAMRQDEGNGQLFMIEGQAVASENSNGGLLKDTGRDVREVDTSLKEDSDSLSDGDDVEYESQDFWLFLGNYFGESDLGFFEQFLQNGADLDEIDKTLSEDFGTSLTTVYWEWAKNQAFESQFTVSNTELNGSCVLAENAVESMEEVTFTPGSGFNRDGFTLEPLTSEVIKYTLQPGSEPYVVSLILDDSTGDPDYLKVYRSHSSPTDECLDKNNPSFEIIPVSPDDGPVTVYGLASNPLRDAGDEREIVLDYQMIDHDVSIDITNPSDGATLPEGEFVDFQSDVTASEGVDWISWVTDNPDDYAGAAPNGEIAGGEDPSPGLLCPGNHTVTATVTDEVGLQASDQVTFTMENQAPQIEFLADPFPSSIGSGDYLILKADPTDKTCEAGPRDNGADESLTDWLIDGLTVGSGRALTHKVTANPGETISVSAEYTDEEGATATAGPRDLNVTSPPPGGYPPRPVIESYIEGDQIKSLTIFLEGRALDAEDGELTGSDLQWTVTDREGDTVTRTGKEADFVGDDEGIHRGGITIELTATDSDGNSSTTSVNVNYVGPG